MTDLDKIAREMLAAECAAAGNKNTAAVIASRNNAILTQAAIDAIRAALLTAPPGYVLVPAEPTGEMLRAALRAPCSGHPETGGQSYPDIYRAMLAAAQEPK